MTTLRKFFILSVVLGLLLALPLWSSPVFSADGGGPTLAVTIDDDVKHVNTDPLLVLVTLSNREATGVASRNRINKRQFEAYKKTEDYKGLSAKEKWKVKKEYLPIEAKEYTLGSKERRVSALVKFLVTDSKGNVVKVTLRLLGADPVEKSAVTLKAASFVGINFGIDSKELTKLSAGVYTIKATIDTTKEKGMWKGMAQSESWSFELAAPKKGGYSPERLAREGVFYRLDGQFEKLAKVATRLIDDEPKSVVGWVHRGDANAGLGSHSDALGSFIFAERYYYEEVEREKPPLIESPVYIINRIRDMQEKLGMVVKE